jgi:hypothetical protein
MHFTAWYHSWLQRTRGRGSKEATRVLPPLRNVLSHDFFLLVKHGLDHRSVMYRNADLLPRPFIVHVALRPHPPNRQSLPWCWGAPNAAPYCVRKKYQVGVSNGRSPGPSSEGAGQNNWFGRNADCLGGIRGLLTLLRAR